VLVVGDCDQSWGSPANPFSGGTDAFVARFNPSGTLLSNTFLGSATYDYGFGIAAEGGKVFVTGVSDVSWGSPVVAHAGGNDAFVAFLTTSQSLLWRDSNDGLLYSWDLDGVTQTEGTFLSPLQVPTNWQVAGTGDFNGDGAPDILWREVNDGLLYVWYMDGVTQASGGFLSPMQVSTNWQIEGVRDFNGDGKPDLLWRDTTDGLLYVWYLDGLTQTGGDFLSPMQVPTNWKISGTGDFNGDGKPDILWRDANDGLLYVWYMDGLTQTGGNFLSPMQVPTTWQISAVGDFNHDGKPDLLWREVNNGLLYVWYLDGLTQTGGDYLSPMQVPTNWEVVGYGAGK